MTTYAEQGSALDGQLAALQASVNHLTILAADQDARLKALEPVIAPPNLKGPTAEPAGPNIMSASTLAGVTLTDKMNALAAGRELSLPPMTYADPDCNRPTNYPVYDYFLAKPAAIHGSGVDKSVLSLPADSLTQGYRRLDAIVEPNTNPYYVMRVDAAAVLEDFTVLGANQGTSANTGKPYSYHGIQLYGTANPTLRRLRIKDVPGSRGVPPDETFAVYGYKITGGFTCEDLVIECSPALEGSSAISCQAGGVLDVVLRRIQVKGRPNGSGWTCFHAAFRSFLVEDFAVDGSLCGLNFEQVVVNGGAAVNNAKDSGIVINRLDVRNPSNRVAGYKHLSIESSKAAGGVSNRVDIHDPVGVNSTNPLGVTISANYGYANVAYGPQAQRGADIHLWMGSTERNDLIKWMRTAGAPISAATVA